MIVWTRKEIEKILIQLNTLGLPFPKHPFVVEGEKLSLLGSGGYAQVYEALDGSLKSAKSVKRQVYAIKVIGFGDQYADDGMFWQTVDAQMNLSLYQQHVVKVYDAVCLDVWLDPYDNVSRAALRPKTEEPEDFTGAEGPADRTGTEGYENQRYLKLQFILMEKLEAVLTKKVGQNYQLAPQALALFQETEIRKVALDIGTALAAAHDKKILHRDIKPENLFYNPLTKRYKLGDFGIALKTADGMASTIAYTDGYGAPEVIHRSDDKYDVTADIYSLGMTLYVLLNRLKFPGSKGYQVDAGKQYESGFVLPAPETGSEELVRIINKMCRFDPDQRYQSMDEVLLELKAITDGDLVRYQRLHKPVLAVLGGTLLIAGTALWKLTFLPDLKFVLSPGSYMLVALCLVKFILANQRKNTMILKFLTLILGAWLCFSTGFVWWKLLLLLFIFAEDTLGGFWGIGMLTANFTYLLAGKGTTAMGQMQDYRWIPITLLPIAAVFIMQLETISDQERNGRQYGHLTEIFLRWNLPWIFAVLYFSVLLSWGWILTDLMTGRNRPMLESILGTKWISAILSVQPLKAGAVGLAFSLFWILRQGILKRVKKVV